MFRAICCISIHKNVAPLALNKVNLDRFVDVINQLQTDLSEEDSLLKRQNQFALRRLEKKQSKKLYLQKKCICTENCTEKQKWQKELLSGL